jgi:hypothetical protein
MSTPKTTKEHVAAQFVEAIKAIASKPENLNNLQHYLGMHFDIWLNAGHPLPKVLPANYASLQKWRYSHEL